MEVAEAEIHQLAGDSLDFFRPHPIRRIDVADDREPGRLRVERRDLQVRAEPLQREYRFPDIARPGLRLAIAQRHLRIVRQRVVKHDPRARRAIPRRIEKVAQRSFEEMQAVDEDEIERMALDLAHDAGVTENPVARVAEDLRAAAERLRDLRIGIDAEGGRVRARERERTAGAHADLEIRARAPPAVNLRQTREVRCREHRGSSYSCASLVRAMHIERCSPRAMIGAEVFGIAAREEQPAEIIDRIRQALFTHHVLVIRDQSLTPEEHLRFARALGHVAPPEPSQGLTTHDETYAEIQALGSPRPEGSPAPDPRPSQADTWHTDYSYLPDPPEIAFLYGVDIPDDGPDTIYLDMQRAYESFPGERRRFFDDVTAVHSQKGSLDPRRYRLPPYVVDGRVGETADERLSADRSASHPLVRTHPVTGVRALYVAQCYVSGQDDLLAEVYRCADDPEFTYRHVWRRGDCVISDNTTTNHRRSKPLSSRRILHRVMISLDA
jgi:taurine dioxygenase